MDELTDFHRRAAGVAIKKMLGGTGFSICDLDAIAKTLGREAALAGKDYAALRALHCVPWADMGPELAEMVRRTCLDLLDVPAPVIEVVAERVQDAPSPAVDKPRLAFLKGSW